MAHLHNFELHYGSDSIQCSVDMESGSLVYSQFPTTLTAKQMSFITSLFDTLIALHIQFDDYQTLECNEVV